VILIDRYERVLDAFLDIVSQLLKREVEIMRQGQSELEYLAHPTKNACPTNDIA
jgi:hypothetical protein